MQKLTHVLVTGMLGLGLAAGAIADDVTKTDKKQADRNYEATVEKAKADYKLAKQRCGTLTETTRMSA